MYNTIRNFAILLLLFIITGCGGHTIKYVNPDANWAYLKKVAVLPFNNLTDDKYAGERVRSAFTVALMSRHVFNVIEQGEVSKVLSVIVRQEGLDEGRVVNLDKETLSLTGEKLGVQALILGSVDEYASSRYGAGSSVTISVRMIDTSSGIILWQAQATETGNSLWRRLLGLNEIESSVLTSRAVDSVLDTVF